MHSSQTRIRRFDGGLAAIAPLALTLAACSAGAHSTESSSTGAGGSASDSSTTDATTTSAASSSTSSGSACAQTICGSSCVDTTTDAANCGACGLACNADETCNDGTCACGTGRTRCADACVDMNADASNCGVCGNACATSETCMSGTCMGNPPNRSTCNNFASGLNAAWVQFAGDVPKPNLNTFNTIFTNTYNSGGRIVRWWFHTNGTVTPGYDSNGFAKPLPQSHIDGVKGILNAAHTAGVAVVISLWSFDMLQSNAGTAHTNNQLLLENDANRQAYIDNYLTPLVMALKGTPGLYSYEIFNEPEGMTPSGWSTYRTTVAAVQKTVNWFASAIHTADPSALVTNGAQTFDYCSNVTGKKNLYSDSVLQDVGGKQNGTLDYYEVHYYTSNGVSNSPFTHPASNWGLDKKLVIGEFSAQGTDGVAQNDLYTGLYSGGYDGGWAWAYTSDATWPAMKTPMQNLFDAHPDVGACP